MSWYDWFSNAVAQGDGLGAVPAPSPYAPQNVPQPPQRPADGAGLYPAMPQPPSRPAGIVPMNANRPAYGDPSVILPSELPGITNNGAPELPPGYAPRNVPLPPQRPTSFAMPQAPQQRRTADLPAPGAHLASYTPTPAAQAPQVPQAPHQPPQAPEGYRFVLQPIDAGAQPGAGASTPTVFGANAPAAGIFNAFTGPQGNVGANGPEIPKVTGLAALLGAQPSLQAQQSTGPTAFLDKLFGFRL